MATAGILALSLVIAPSDLDDPTKPQVRTVQLASFALPSAATTGALVQKIIIRSQDQAVVPVTPMVGGGGAANVIAADVASPLAIDSAIKPQEAGAATLAATAAPLAILSPLLANPFIASIVGPILLFGPLIVLVVLACPLCALFNVLSYIPSYFGIYLPVPAVAPASTATVEETATVIPTLKSDSLVADSTSGIIATAGPASAGGPIETGSADVSPPVTSTDKPTETEQGTSTESETVDEQISTDTARPTKDATEITNTDGESTGPTAASTPEPSAASESEPAKPTVRLSMHRPFVRSLIGAGERVRELLHRGNVGDRPTRTADVGGVAPSAGPSSVDDPSGDADEPSGDADGS